MISLKNYIGRSSAQYRDQVTEGQIGAFCKTLGIDDFSVAPPTFLTLFRKGEFELFQQLGLELSRVLHTEQEYIYENRIMAGDSIYFETTVLQVLEKARATSFTQFITFETHFDVERDAKKVSVGKSRTSILIREKS